MNERQPLSRHTRVCPHRFCYQAHSAYMVAAGMLILAMSVDAPWWVFVAVIVGLYLYAEAVRWAARRPRFRAVAARVFARVDAPSPAGEEPGVDKVAARPALQVRKGWARAAVALDIVMVALTMLEVLTGVAGRGLSFQWNLDAFGCLMVSVGPLATVALAVFLHYRAVVRPADAPHTSAA